VRACDLKIGGAVAGGPPQPAGEQDGREAVLLRTDDGELPCDLGVTIIDIV
jgi:hypothetical protein